MWFQCVSCLHKVRVTPNAIMEYECKKCNGILRPFVPQRDKNQNAKAKSQLKEFYPSCQ